MNEVWADAHVEESNLTQDISVLRRALEWLERTYEDRTDWLVWLRVGSELDSLRGHLRFADPRRHEGALK